MLVDLRHLIWSANKHSSGGQYLKAEEIRNGVKYFYKLSDFRNGNFVSHESVLEVIVSRLGTVLEFPVLKYTGDLAVVHFNNNDYTTFVCCSKNYCKANEVAMPLLTEFQLYKQKYRLPLDYCMQNGLTKYMDYVFLFDYLITNTDRHGGNIEILHSNDGTVRIAPIFDNGRCLTAVCGNNLDNILRWQYKENPTVNNFVGSLYLDKNLQYVRQSYKVPKLDDVAFKHIFYGLRGELREQHIKLLQEAIMYRYNDLRKRGLFV